MLLFFFSVNDQMYYSFCPTWSEILGQYLHDVYSRKAFKVLIAETQCWSWRITRLSDGGSKNILLEQRADPFVWFEKDTLALAGKAERRIPPLSPPVHNTCHNKLHGSKYWTRYGYPWYTEDEFFWLCWSPDFSSSTTTRSTFLFLSEISRRLFDVLPWNAVQVFMLPRWCILVD